MQRKQAARFLCFDLSRRECRGAKNRAKQVWIREDQKFKNSVQWCWNLAAQLSLECFIWVNSGISDPIPEQDWQIVDTVFPGGTRAKFPVVQRYPIVYRRFFFVEFKSWNLRPTQWTRDGVEETPALPDLNILRFSSQIRILLESNISCRSDATGRFQFRHMLKTNRAILDTHLLRDLISIFLILVISHEINEINYTNYFFLKVSMKLERWILNLEHYIYVRPLCLAVAGAYRNPTIGFTIGFSFMFITSKRLSSPDSFRVNGKPCR